MYPFKILSKWTLQPIFMYFLTNHSGTSHHASSVKIKTSQVPTALLENILKYAGIIMMCFKGNLTKE